MKFNNKKIMGDLVEINLNYEGTNVVAVVPIEEANILLNDETAALKYVQALMQQENTLQDLSGSKKNMPNALSSKEATLIFFELRNKYSNKFDDRKTLKQALWQKIAGEMKEMGIDIQEGREGAEKCRQKFANLQRTYLNYIKHKNTTGAERRDPPPYFNEMNAILGEKDKVNPPYLEYSLEIVNEPSSSTTSLPGSSNTRPSSNNIEMEIKNRFSSHKTSVRPISNLNKVIDLLKEQHNEVRADRAQYMKILENAIILQNQQRADFLKILKKKRRRSNSSSSDDSFTTNFFLNFCFGYLIILPNN